MDGQLLVGPHGSYVWKALDLIFNSSTAKCADRLPEQKSPTANTRSWREGKWMLFVFSLFFILPVGKSRYERWTVETNTDGKR
jgi:hypothetical protein